MTIALHPDIAAALVTVAILWSRTTRQTKLVRSAAPHNAAKRAAPRRRFATVPTLTEDRWVNGQGYVMVRAEGHPLVGRTGVMGEHRRVLYDAIGPGVHPCHWCLAPVAWTEPGDGQAWLVVDHVDGDKQNNDRANLVPSCKACNAVRTAPLVDADPAAERRCTGAHGQPCPDSAPAAKGPRCADCHREYERHRKALNRERQARLRARRKAEGDQ